MRIVISGVLIVCALIFLWPLLTRYGKQAVEYFKTNLENTIEDEPDSIDDDHDEPPK